MKKYLITLVLFFCVFFQGFAQFNSFVGFEGFPGFGDSRITQGKAQDDESGKKLSFNASYGINFTPYYENVAHHFDVGLGLKRLNFALAMDLFSVEYTDVTTYADVTSSNSEEYTDVTYTDVTSSNSELGFSLYGKIGFNVLKIKRFALTANALAGLYSVPMQESDSYGSSLQWDEEGFLFGAEMECKFFVLKNLALQLSGGFTNIGASFNAGLSLSI